jgi:predicted secreted hydrolase
MIRIRPLPLFFAVFLILSPGLILRGAAAAPGWMRADAPKTWHFPRDNGAHDAYKTEWWYLTGILNDDRGEQYGFEMTFFREGVRLKPEDPGNPWSLRDIYFAHFAITDVSGKHFMVDERASRKGPGLAGASVDRLGVWLLDWRAREEGGRLFLEARGNAAELNLELDAMKAPVLHGTRGLSRKGSLPGQASYYVSFTDLRASGLLRIPRLAQPVRVRGVCWFDHEFGSAEIAPNQSGWDWFGLHLSDGRDLMLYFLRRTDGSVEPESSGTIVDRSGRARHVTLTQVTVDVLDHWRSQKSGGVYPSRWRVRIPAEGLDVTLSPLLADQELSTPGSTGVTYWEGAVEGRGTSGNGNVMCQGYVEMTGYAGKLGALF